ncbi:eukaryotic translation initiation factor 2-alpha kinase [Aureococcus anophagefferens]|nr:eukaryotic translation initiation factor 2-alpha kinase [Aureococcus anophagefferens]
MIARSLSALVLTLAVSIAAAGVGDDGQEKKLQEYMRVGRRPGAHRHAIAATGQTRDAAGPVRVSLAKDRIARFRGAGRLQGIWNHKDAKPGYLEMELPLNKDDSNDLLYTANCKPGKFFSNAINFEEGTIYEVSSFVPTKETTKEVGKFTHNAIMQNPFSAFVDDSTEGGDDSVVDGAENVERRREELEALEAIYGEEKVWVEGDGGDALGVVCVTLEPAAGSAGAPPAVTVRRQRLRAGRSRSTWPSARRERETAAARDAPLAPGRRAAVSTAASTLEDERGALQRRAEPLRLDSLEGDVARGSLSSDESEGPLGRGDDRESSRFHADFKEVGVLGRGGCGEVCRCLNRLDRRTYAIKKAWIEGLEAPREPEMAFEDFDLCQNFSEDDGSDSSSDDDDALGSSTRASAVDRKFGGCLYIQMEYCATTLRQAIDSGRLAGRREDAWRLLRQIIEALAYLHGLKLVHRDLKPANVKLGDLGLATTVEDDDDRAPARDLAARGPRPPNATPTSLAGTERAWSESSATGGAMDDTMTSLTRGVGTFLYRAPEVAAAGPGQHYAGQETKICDTTSMCKHYDHAADMYSLGIVAFEVAHAPWDTAMERVEHIQALRRAGDRPAAAAPGVFAADADATVAALVVALVRQDPGERPGAAALLEGPLLPARAGSSGPCSAAAGARNPLSETRGVLVDALFDAPTPEVVDLGFDASDDDGAKPAARRRRAAARPRPASRQRRAAPRGSARSSRCSPRLRALRRAAPAAAAAAAGRRRRRRRRRAAARRGAVLLLPGESASGLSRAARSPGPSGPAAATPRAASSPRGPARAAPRGRERREIARRARRARRRRRGAPVGAALRRRRALRVSRGGNVVAVGGRYDDALARHASPLDRGAADAAAVAVGCRVDVDALARAAAAAADAAPPLAPLECFVAVEAAPSDESAARSALVVCAFLRRGGVAADYAPLPAEPGAGGKRRDPRRSDHRAACAAWAVPWLATVGRDGALALAHATRPALNRDDLSLDELLEAVARAAKRRGGALMVYVYSTHDDALDLLSLPLPAPAAHSKKPNEKAGRKGRKR